jgi:putative sterol carrier protein
MPDDQAEIFAKMTEFANRLSRDSVKPLLRDWDRRIVLIDQDTQQALAIQIKDGALAGMAAVDGTGGTETDVTLRGKRADLLGLLDGSLNPGQAVLEDRLQVSAHPDDQIRLDALSFALWDD